MKTTYKDAGVDIKAGEEMVNRMGKLESTPIPIALNYSELSNITIEAREKLAKIQPQNLGQASRISGVSPADITVLMVLLKKWPTAKQI